MDKQRFKGSPVSWLDSDDAASIAQGWGLFDSDSRGLEIEKDDDSGRFESDQDAKAYVQGLADAGDDRAKRALILVKEMARPMLAYSKPLGDDLQIVYGVTLNFSVSACGPCTKAAILELVKERIEAGEGIQEEDIEKVEIVSVESM